MHLPDHLLNSGLAGGLLAGAAALLGYAFGKVMKAVTAMVHAFAGNNGQKISTGSFSFSKGAGSYFAKLAIIALWVFACQMFNLPVTSSTSVHLIGGVFAVILVGPYAGALVIALVLIVQSVFFGDGGISALGANIFNMAFIGAFAAYYVYKSLAEKNYYLAVIAACLFSVLGAAFSCLTQLSISGAVSFTAAFKDMMGLHFLAAVVEIALTLMLLKAFKGLNYENR